MCCLFIGGGGGYITYRFMTDGGSIKEIINTGQDVIISKNIYEEGCPPDNRK